MSNESGGIFEKMARDQGVDILHVPVFETNEIPPVLSTHLLVMGGPMSVNDEQELPWLKAEKQVIREHVKRGQPVLGICLGAQLIASAFGAAVYPCEPELGWSTVTAVNPILFPALPGQFRVFQMHGETFDIPEGATLVYRGENVHSQALCVGSALGLQFHIELTLPMIQDWISDRPLEEMSHHLSQSREYLPKSRMVCKVIADRLLSAPPSGFSWMQQAG